MARLTLDRELRLVQDEILILGSLVEQAILNAVDALRRRDIAAAMDVQHNDRRINNKRFAIENRILILLATQSPMADKAISMLHRALDAFIAEDEAAARQIPLEDDEVDELYNLVYHKLIQTMINDPQAIDHANQILWVIHNLERTADRVTNICERIVFIHTGELMEMDSEDDESEDEDENLDTA